MNFNIEKNANNNAIKSSSETTKSMPAFKFADAQNTYDFATIPEGPAVKHDFIFENTGDVPLVIINAQASCGCTSPSFPKEPILPGKKGVISVTYTTQGHLGNFRKSIYITSNALGNNANNQFELFITGIVVLPSRLNP
jgi:hypothetical protein